MSRPGMNALITHLAERLKAGESFDNPALIAAADEHLDGTIGQGAYQYQDAYNAMEAAVNVHLLRDHAKALVTGDFLASLAVLRRLMSRLPTQNIRDGGRNDLQQFSTPPTLALLAARLLSPLPGKIILEPSAGTGSLAIWPQAIGSTVICNEIDKERRDILIDTFAFESYGVDGAFLHDMLPQDIKPDFILMNPPFSATGGKVTHNDPKYGAMHITSALKRLKEGGRLVAISGQGMNFMGSAFTAWWQKLAANYHVRANLALSGKEYEKYGTKFNIQIIVVDKVGPTPGENWREQREQIVWGGAQNIEEAWTYLHHLAEDLSPPEDEAVSAIFIKYTPKRIKGGLPHPAPAVEAISMAGIDPPPISYRPHLPHRLVKTGALTALQIESIIYAGQRHEQRLGDGSRAAYVVGHGTGIGKGRIAAGIIADNWYQGRRRAIWFSVNRDLHVAALDDLKALGLNIPLRRINDFKIHEEITLDEGIIFCSYNALIAESKQTDDDEQPLRRFDQIVRWLGEDAVVILDECHRAKNALSGGWGDPTKTGLAVIDLQDPDERPNYRIIYSSATDSTEVRNMVYMTRLGLWGPGTNFDSFGHFQKEVESGGLGVLEMISRDMKALGMRLSASISFKGVEYRERIHKLTPDQRRMYDAAARAWRFVLQNIREALEETNASNKARGRAFNRFWGDNQRFFRLFICALKVPTLLDEVERALKRDQSVVVSLIGTGEARTKERIAEAMAEDGNLDHLDFTPREILFKMITAAFPTICYEDETDKQTEKTKKIIKLDENQKPVHSQTALDMRQALLDSLTDIDLPDNPLDQIIQALGEKNVAEITGRRRRITRKNGKTEYVKRAEDGTPMDRTNIEEMRLFQAGQKRVAIISDAGAMGISLHSSLDAGNQQRRVHIVFELGWSADKQLQTFGRTHRSNQARPPIYILIYTECAGEYRFVATIARRIGSLGALTKGDRGAADSGDLGRYNFETSEGRAALRLTYKRIMAGENVPGLSDPRQSLRDIGLIRKDADGIEEIREEDEDNIPRFLNRILALDIDEQNALFNYFAELFDQTVAHAKANGLLDEGVTDIHALAIRMKQKPRTIAQDRVTGAKTFHYVLETDQKSGAVPFDEAFVQYQMFQTAKFYQETVTGDFFLALPSRRQTDPKEGVTRQTYSIWRPAGARLTYFDDLDFARRSNRGRLLYEAVTPEEARDWWQRRFALIPPIKTIDMHILAGAILPIWNRLKVDEDAKLDVVRVGTEEGERIVGVLIPKKHLRKILREIGVGGLPQNPEECFNTVVYEGVSLNLIDGITLQQRFIPNTTTPAIEIGSLHSLQFQQMRRLGVLNPIVHGKQRFFIPTDPARGVEVLTKVLDIFPLLPPEEEEPDTETPGEINPEDVVDVTLGEESVDLETWLIDPEEIDAALQSIEDLEIQARAAEISLKSNPQPEPEPPPPPIINWRQAKQQRLFEM